MTDLRSGKRVLMDGATGTEIERRGVPPVQEAWSSTGALHGPEVVCEVHQDYLRAGARVVISNTFSTSRHALADAGMEDHFEALNRQGVELVRQAIEETGDGRAVVAGGITDWSWTRNYPSPYVVNEGAAAQAKIMAAAGADMIVLEMMADIDRMLAIVDATQQTGLPVWVGLSCTTGAIENERGEPPQGAVRLLGGATLAEGVDALKDRDVPVLGIMHTEVEDVDPCLDVLDQVWSGPVCVYAHSGHFVKPNWIFNDVISPRDYAAYSQRWLDRGVQVLGGCCGIGPDHIDLLRPMVEG